MEREDHKRSEIPAWGRWDTSLLLLLLVFFLASRLLWIWLNPATASYWEESYRWFAAHEILNGATWPLLDYQADHYQGGSLVVILLALPIFKLAGESILTLKLVAILLSAMTMAMLYALARKFFGRTAALLAGLSYLAGPPVVAFWGLVPMGFHGESTLLSLLQVYVFIGLLTGEWRSSRGWLIFGLVCGAGFSFTYITLLSAAACGLTWLLLEGFPRWRDLGWVALGFLVGLSPWLAYNASHEFAGLARIAEVFGASEAIDPWRMQTFSERLSDFLIRVPLQGLLDPSKNALPGAWGRLILVGSLAPVALALTAAVLRMGGVFLGVLQKGTDPAEELARRELVFGVYAAIFALAYLSSRFTLDAQPLPVTYRLFPPLIVLLMIPVAVSAQRILTRSTDGLRRATQAAVAICFLATTSATVAFAMRPPDPGSALSLQQGYLVCGRLLHRKYAQLEDVVSAARTVADPDGRRRVFAGIGWEAQHRFETRGNFEDLLAEIAVVPERERVEILGGLLWASKARTQELSARAEPDERDLVALERMRELATIIDPELAELKRKLGMPLGPGRR